MPVATSRILALFLPGVLFSAMQTAAAASPAPDAIGLEFFERKIRPVLVESCHECHSADGKKLKGGLYLDSREGLLKGGDSGAALVPGNPDASLLLRAVRYTDQQLQMPPVGKLPAEVVSDFEAWIRMGAPDPRDGAPAGAPTRPPPDTSGHWAFKTPAVPPLPPVRNGGWPQSPLDRFILHRLERAGLHPAPPADRHTLLRRVTFDLTGLPPAPEEIKTFLADASPEAFARVVDRLLASPHYGERWGRHWLDLARYADTNGMDENKALANAFRYRDYVVRAFNEDKPYNRFIQEQLAGDLLPGPVSLEETFERWMATGFLVLGPKNLAEQDKTKMVMDIVDEQIDVVSRAFLGLTVSCARCHDHKFEPVSTREYYALAGIFRSTKTMENLAFVSKWNERPLASPESLERVSEHQKAVAGQTGKIDQLIRTANGRLQESWRRDLGGYLLAATPATTGNPKHLERPVEQRQLAPEVVKNWSDWLAGKEADGLPVFQLWRGFAALAQERFAEEGERLVGHWKDEVSAGRIQLPALAATLLESPAPASLAVVAERFQRLFDSVDKAWQEALDGNKGQPPKKLEDAGLEALRQVLHGAKGPFALPSKPETLYPPETTAALAAMKRELESLQAAAPPAPDLTLAVAEGNAKDLPVHIRGSHLTLAADAVPRGFLQLAGPVGVSGIGPGESGRLQLAYWISHSQNPLTARVMVNRIWQGHFGEGLVRTPDNFGISGEDPTHPELLDWLAGEFVRRGWSVKELHRLIVLSSAYQMSSRHDVRAKEADPDNRLLWRMNRRRLEVEAIRDNLLAVGGRLDRTMGGSLHGYKNNEYARDRAGQGADYEAPRRSLYLPVNRSSLYEVFGMFDFADAGVATGRRAASVVPQQALFFLNSPLARESAGHLAGALLAREDVSDRQRVELAYLRTVGRPARMEEIERAVGYLEKATSLSSSKPDAERRKQAWQGFCQGLMASNEFIYID